MLKKFIIIRSPNGIIYNQETVNKLIDELNIKDSTKTQLKARTITLFKMTTSPDLFISLITPDIVIQQIKNSKIKNTGDNYSLNTQEITVRTLLTLIDKLNIPVTPATKQKLKYEFEIYKIKTHDQTEHRKTSDEFAVLPFSVYKRKILDAFGVHSKQYLIVSMYGDVTCRDDFTVKIVKSKDQVLPDEHNYLIVPLNHDLNITIILHSYKTDARHGVIEREFSKESSALIRAYIDGKKIQYGNYLFAENNNGLTNYVSQFNKKIGVKGSINYIRHSVVTEEKSKGNFTPEERKRLADFMMHSPITQLSYVRKLASNSLV